jgi:hypothetical protein
MMLMAAAYGADIRLVAFLQYLRVLLVAFAGTDPDPDGGCASALPPSWSCSTTSIH